MDRGQPRQISNRPPRGTHHSPLLTFSPLPASISTISCSVWKDYGDLMQQSVSWRGGSDAKFNQKCVFIVHVEREYLDSSNTNGQSVKKIT